MSPASKHGGRHASAAPAAKVRRWWLVGAALVLVLALALPASLAIGWPTGDGGGEDCPRTETVSLAVDPALSGPVTRTVEGSVQAELGCVRLVVSKRPSAEVAAEISRRSGQGLARDLPDLWLPDSRVWVALAQSTEIGAQRLTGAFPAVAQSPVVVALRQARAGSVSWPDTAPPATALLGGTQQKSLGLTDPGRDTAGLATLLQIGRTAAADATAAIAGFARSVRVTPLGDALGPVVRGRLGAVTTTERAVVMRNRKTTGEGRLAAFGGSAPPVAVAPLAVVSAAAGDTGPPAAAVREAETALRQSLLSTVGQSRLRAAGLRDRDGRLAAGFRPAGGLRVGRLPAWVTPNAAQVRATIDAWGALGRRGRVIVALDSSGSMAGTLPGSRTTKSALARRALDAVVSSIAPDSDMGLWTFTSSTGRDYRVRVPLGPADARVDGVPRRTALRRAIDSLRPVPVGGTGLYDTTLAAYRAASQSFAYGRLNAVLVITDGRDEDPGSVGLGGLLRDLRREYDGIKPVRIINIAYGGDADLTVLRRIADVTGGATYRAPTAADVGPLLARVLADL